MHYLNSSLPIPLSQRIDEKSILAKKITNSIDETFDYTHAYRKQNDLYCYEETFKNKNK